MIRRPPRSPLFPSPPLSRSLRGLPQGPRRTLLRVDRKGRPAEHVTAPALTLGLAVQPKVLSDIAAMPGFRDRGLLRSEEHTSELQSPCNLVCRLLLEKKKNK